jgi:endonuclease/exonuclease/phosphatase (EEP) superfamily protein YafD
LRSKKLRRVRNGKYILILPVFVLLFGWLFFLTSRQYNDFYTWEWFESTHDILTWDIDLWNEWIDILYSNILYTNDNYTGLLTWINEHNPDMIFMVEFTDEHDDFLWEKLKKDYPYSARTAWSEKYFGGVVFGKKPIKNLTHKVNQWAWRYSYFNTNYDEQTYDIYLIHTSSPITYSNFLMRNRQFDTIVKDYIIHKQSRNNNDKVIMLWDFNVSPWSKFYKDFKNNLSWLTNITDRFSTLFTWHVSFLPFLQSHIDHIFVSDNLKVGNVEKINTPWSDHRGFYLKNVR